jgi:hypothetical protein
LVVLLGAAAAIDCGADNSGVGPSGMTSTTPFDLPTVINSGGGPVLSAPRVQAIYFSGHPFVDDIDGFLARLAASPYWPGVVAEYGVGGLTVLPSHVSSIAGPDSIVSTDIQALFARVMDADAAALGPASPDTIYLMLFPATTTVVSSGQALCQPTTASGYHTEAVAGGTSVALVVIPFCTSFPGTKLSGVSALTPTISHELVESSTDPFPASAPAFLTTDERHAMWAEAVNGGEAADLCENESPNLAEVADIGLPVQRIWSNAAAAAGTGPCVPVPAGEIYFTAIPRLPDQVTVQRDGKRFSVPALRAAVGASAMVSVTLRSEGDRLPSWAVGALEYHADVATLPHPLPKVGRSHQTLSLGVVPSAASAGVFPLIVTSEDQAGDAVHFWIGTMQRQ